MTLKEFEAQFNPEIIEIAAVTGFREASSAHRYGEIRLFSSIELIAWQNLASGEVYEERITLCDMAAEARDFEKHFKKESIVKLKVQASKDVSNKKFRFVKKMTSLFSDFSELKTILKQQQEPFSFNDEHLGKLKLNRAFDQFEGEVLWCGNSVRLSLGCNGGKDDQASMQFARELVNAQKSWDARVCKYAAQGLLPIANDCWLEEEIDEAEFIRRIVLVDISVDGDDNFSFWFDDGDIFWGHTIAVYGNHKEGLYDVSILG